MSSPGSDPKPSSGTTLPRRRGRPQQFNAQDGVAIAARLFHRAGYEGVSVADLTQALKINPPSLYAAYGSKLGLFERAIRAYAADELAQVQQALRAERSAAEALGGLLETAAIRYSSRPATPGCMIATALQSHDDAARGIAVTLTRQNEALLEEYLWPSASPGKARTIVQFVMQNLRGLSLNARLGYSSDDLVRSARIAAGAVSDLLETP